LVQEQSDVAALGAKERQVTDASADAVAANIVPQASTFMTGLRGRQSKRRQYGDPDKNPKKPVASLLPH